MVPFKGRLTIPQHMTKKPIHFGINLWMLESEPGYCLSCDVHPGKQGGGMTFWEKLDKL